MLSLPIMSRFPLLMLITMRGEWASSIHGRYRWDLRPEPQALRRMTLNLAHTEADIDATVAAAEEVLSELVRMQLLESA